MKFVPGQPEQDLVDVAALYVLMLAHHPFLPEAQTLVKPDDPIIAGGCFAPNLVNIGFSKDCHSAPPVNELQHSDKCEASDS
jgi:hypothetical protein